MIAGIFHEGSGLGDQLFRYITVRTLAEEKGLAWGMLYPYLFKGEDFMKLDMGYGFSDLDNYEKAPRWNEKDVRDAQGNDIRSYDPEINFIEDNTIIDGSFEDDKYWGHNLANINKWLTVEPLEVPDDVCIIGFRGGEYTTQPDLFLQRNYFEEAVNKMLEINPQMKFEVHTDDPNTAITQLNWMTERKIPWAVIDNAPLSHSKHTNMGFNWRSARYAKYAIIPNSAFFIIPRLLKHFEDPTAVTIAPRYWARHNRKIWARPACFYKQFKYI